MDLWGYAPLHCGSGTPGDECGSNNGNVVAAVYSGPVSLTQYFQYDSLNQLKLAAEAPSDPTATTCPDGSGQCCRVYGYDRWGNRTVAEEKGQGSAGSLTPGSFSAATNRIADTGWGYDGAGNITSNPAGGKFTYDAEGRQTRYCQDVTGDCTDATANTVYSYDGDGRRIKKVTSTGTTVFVYDATGQLAAEYTTEPSSATLCTTCYLTVDHLGSTRLITDPAGTPVERRDYLPFGEEITVSTGNPRYGVPGYADDGGIRLKFTGKERDAETGLDYFGARYFSGAQGRFTTPDPLMASARVSDPQTWNRYSYALNNPLRYFDPDGLAELSAEECAKKKSCVIVKLNVIYDANSNLTAEQKSYLTNTLVQNAKNEYGDSDVHFDVSTGTGKIETDENGNLHVEGLAAGAINIIGTTNENIRAPGGAGIVEGKAAVFLNLRKDGADSQTLGHELAHLFLGDASSRLNSVVNAISQVDLGATKSLVNAFRDVSNDMARGPHPATVLRPPISPDGFNLGARRFSVPPVQKAIRPTQN